MLLVNKGGTSKRFDDFRNFIVDFNISLLTLTLNSSDPYKITSDRLL